MADSITWVGLDVHKENIVAVAIGRDGSHQGRFEMTNSPKGKERLLARLGSFPKVRCAYEAGPTGYDLKRFLDGKGVDCQVIAPSLIPRRPGDRIKTDTKDAEKIARMHRMGELVAIHVPTPRQESMRDLLGPGRTPAKTWSGSGTASESSSCAREGALRGSRGVTPTGSGSGNRNSTTRTPRPS